MTEEPKELSDKEILDTVIGGRLISEMTAIEFMGFIAGKMQGLSTYTAANQELALAVGSPPMGRLMPELEKVRLIRKVLQAGAIL